MRALKTLKTLKKAFTVGLCSSFCCPLLIKLSPMLQTPQFTRLAVAPALVTIKPRPLLPSASPQKKYEKLLGLNPAAFYILIYGRLTC